MMTFMMWMKAAAVKFAAAENVRLAKGFLKSNKIPLFLKTKGKVPINLEQNHQRVTKHCTQEQIGLGRKLRSPFMKYILPRKIDSNLMATLKQRGFFRGNFIQRQTPRLPLLSLIGISLGIDTDEFFRDEKESLVNEMRDKLQKYELVHEPLEKLPESLEDLDINLSSIANGCEGAVYEAKVKDESTNSKDSERYDLALKAVFNYGAESNASSIFRDLQKETVPLRAQALEKVKHILGRRNSRLPPHPNIIDMPGVFIDDMLVTEEGMKKFPAALPSSLNPDLCYGRNKTLYLIMKRRSCQLREYLTNRSLTMKTRVLLLCQLLEGVAHLRKHGVAHRDLKSDNILINISTDDEPQLEICDFGCCLAEDSQSLKVPYFSRDIYIGGNSFLMAPEIACAKCGAGCVLDYSKSDLWAAGALAYEILGGENPFYPGAARRKVLSSKTYCEQDLPALPGDVPLCLQKLVYKMLSRDPNKRPSAKTAVTVSHICRQKLETPNLEHAGGKWMKLREGQGQHNSVYVSKEALLFQEMICNSFRLFYQVLFPNSNRSLTLEKLLDFQLMSSFTYMDFKSAACFF